MAGRGAICLLLCVLLAGCGPKADADSPHTGTIPDLAGFVDPFIGTVRDGNTFAGATGPFGMVQWSPDTSAGGLVRPGDYNYGDPIIRGFSLTHLSGAGCAALGNVSFLPTVRPLSVPPLPNASPYSDRFRHADESASPGVYRVRLASGTDVMLTAAARSGLGMVRFPSVPRATILIDAGSGAGAHTNVDGAQAAAVRIVGDRDVEGWAAGGAFCGLHNHYTVYFTASFDRPFAVAGTWAAGRLHPGSRVATGPHSGAFLQFDTRRNRTVRMRVGLSYVDVAGARRNLQVEQQGWSLPVAAARTRATWNELLNRARVEGGARREETVFYTALYHALLHPNVFSDVDGRYAGFDRRIHRASGYRQYANFSGWDIYRSEIQLLAWLVPGRTGDMMQSLVADAQQGGRLPKWPVANDYTGEMNGDSADPILSSAFAFGARRFDARAALHFMEIGADQPGIAARQYQERPNLSDYLRLGYLPPATGAYGSVATTLEYASDDFAIARLAQALGDRQAATRYTRRSTGWQRLLNPTTHLLQPRMADGNFVVPFDPSRMDGYVEGNAWQYRWMTPQDLPGVIRAMGGREAVVRALDQLFRLLNAGPEREGYWAGNEPGLGIPWIYDFAGRPDRTQAVVRRIITTQYGPNPGDLPGNDDLGTLSAWYVWAAMGLYPEIPGVGGLALGSPLFPHMVLATAGGRVTIDAPGAAPSRPLVERVKLNGKRTTAIWLPLSRLDGDARLEFTLKHDVVPAG